MRHLALIPLVALVALFAGCTSKDAGETLTVEVPESGLVLIRDTPATDAVTPEKYKGKTTVVAKVIYKGRGTLAYQWTVALPGAISATVTTSNEKLDIDATVLGLQSVAPDIGSGRGTITLEVYEKAGSLSKKASAGLIVVTSTGG